jgi:hypothetical protein
MNGIESLWEIDFSPKTQLVRKMKFIAWTTLVFLFLFYSFFNPYWKNLFAFSYGANEVQNVQLLLIGMLSFSSIFVHIIVQAFFMKIFGARRLRIKFSIRFVYIGCDKLFNQAQYLVIILLPSIIVPGYALWRFFLADVGGKWVWYIILVANVVSVIANMFIAYKVIRTDKKALFQDSDMITRAVISTAIQ